MHVYAFKLEISGRNKETCIPQLKIFIPNLFNKTVTMFQALLLTPFYKCGN